MGEMSEIPQIGAPQFLGHATITLTKKQWVSVIIAMTHTMRGLGPEGLIAGKLALAQIIDSLGDDKKFIVAMFGPTADPDTLRADAYVPMPPLPEFNAPPMPARWKWPLLVLGHMLRGLPSYMVAVVSCFFGLAIFGFIYSVFFLGLEAGWWGPLFFCPLVSP
jgi:hypothetical protein